MEALPQLDRPIRVIGRYALYGKLAAGGMATVHFGRLLGPAGFSRTVAIKRLHPQFAKDPEFVAMFLDEARLAARIQHPNVVATVDVVALDDELFLVMDYIRGESFSRLLRASRKQGVDVSLGVIGSVATGMLHGLHAAHEAKDEQGKPLSVVHRDVSPQNVLVGVDGVARVLDFGVAKAAARVQVTRDGQMKGKLSYMSPEQILGKGVDRRTDIFAAGIVIWEALTGRRLFDAEEAQEVLRMIMSEDIPPPSAVVPSISRDVDAIVMKGLARDPAARYQTAREFAIAMERAASLVSPREVGEWVERVAGETLMNREQAVAEIEAVSEASVPTETSPGFMRTLNERLPAVRTEQPASQWDEGPTRVFDAEGGAPGTPGDATRVHGPPKQVSPPVRRGSTRLGFPAPPAPPAKPQEGGPARPSGSSAARPPKASTPPPKPGAAPPKPGAAPPKPGAAPPRASTAPPRASTAPPRASPAAPPPRRAAPPSGARVASEREGSAARAAARGAGSRGPAADASRKAEGPPSLTALGFDDENETTNVFDPTKHGFDDENETTNVFDPTKHGFDDESETTNVFDPTKHGFDDENEKTTVYDSEHHVPGPGSRPASRPAPGASMRIADLPTDPRAASLPPPLPPPSLPRASAPPPPSGARPSRSERPVLPTPTPAAGEKAPAPAASVIVQDVLTDPAIFRKASLPPPGPLAELRAIPLRRALAIVGLALGVGVTSFFVVLLWPRPSPPAEHEMAPEMTRQSARGEALPAPAKAEPPPPPEPAGIDPSTLPLADRGVTPAPSPLPPRPAQDDSPPPPARSPEKPVQPAAATRAPEVPVVAGPDESKSAPVATPPQPALPAGEPVEVENPYASSPAKPAKAAPAEAPPRPKVAAPEKPAGKPSAPAAKADCSQPFTVDEKGIRRIRPECL